jgi:hypothetical protein
MLATLIVLALQAILKEHSVVFNQELSFQRSEPGLQTIQEELLHHLRLHTLGNNGDWAQLAELIE